MKLHSRLEFGLTVRFWRRRISRLRSSGIWQSNWDSCVGGNAMAWKFVTAIKFDENRLQKYFKNLMTLHPGGKFRRT
jgi:hypothetical protein